MVDHPPSPLAAELDRPEHYTGDPHPLYARLRAECPVAWNDQSGYWAVTTHPEVQAVGTDPATFCSSRGILVDEIGTTYDNPPTMMHTDPPAHTRYRRLVQPGFRPSVVRTLEPRIRAQAKALVDPLPAGEPVDVVQALAVPYPLQVICGLLGVPGEEWPRFYRWSEAAIPGAVELDEEERAQTMAEMWAYLVGVAEERRRNPTDDLVSAVATATIDGDELSEPELAMFLIQLLVAGNETTRNLLSGGLAALADQPGEWARLRSDPDLLAPAADELARLTTPVISFLRTATVDTELRGTPIGAGDPVLLIYASANRDEAVFGSGADRLDVGRQPNPHVAFGFGPHFCLGAALARLEIRIVLEELTGRFATLEPAGEVTRAPSPVIAGVTAAPLRFTAA